MLESTTGYNTIEQLRVIVAMAEHHGANLVYKNRFFITAEFVYQVDFDRYELELAAYIEQQDWFDSIGDDGAAELGLVL